ncbi:MAG: CPBP family intramembrane metalloprotease [Bacteroidales bacterium]
MTALKGIFAGRAAWFQSLILAACMLGCFILFSLVFLLFPFVAADASPNALRLYQLGASVCVLLLPALATAWLCGNDLRGYLSLKRLPDAAIWGTAFAGMLLLSPVTTLTATLNGKLRLPAFMKPVEQWLQAIEASAEALTEKMLTPTDCFSLPFNLLVVGVAAAVAEEFFFRGTLQRILERRITNPHTVIWVTACIFSAMHLQFYGFVPRLLIGAYLGYLLYWSKSIWLPVFAHFTNNAIALAGMSNQKMKEYALISDKIPDAELLPFCVIAACAFCLFLIAARYIRQRAKAL